jgi:L-threonylcarbamoyladenylate synthase
MIKEGGIIAVPTETVYGLAASIEHPEAIERIFSLKGRPSNNPLITHVSCREQIERFVHNFPEGFDELAEAFWPGPLTLVIPVVKETVPSIIRAGLPTAAFRVPSHPMARKLILGAGPVVMPSANLSGKPSSTAPAHIEMDFGRDFPVIDGGVCEKGIESTVLVFNHDKWEVGRLGGITSEQIETVLGYFPKNPVSIKQEKPLCPGQLFRHYAPNATLHTEESIPESCTVIIGFSGRTYPSSKTIKILGPIDNPDEVAKLLYQTLRELDLEKVSHAWVDMNFPEGGLWACIRERIKKAAS